LKYNKIAHDYNNKRKKPWRDFVFFYEDLKNDKYKFKGIIIDLGCANGRHFEILKNKNNRLIGIDNSIELINIANKKLQTNNNLNLNLNEIQLLLADLNNLPIRKNTINAIFSIAVIHHIITKQLRYEFFSKIYKLMKSNSLMLFTVWRRWQKRYRFYFLKIWIKRKVIRINKKKKNHKNLKEFGDILIPWKIASNDLMIDRFYHLYSSREVKKSLKNFVIKRFVKLGGPNKKDNFFVLAQKL